MSRLSPQEALLGFIATVFFTIKIGPLGALLALITGLLWPIGGTYLKSVRRWGVPIAVSIFLQNPWAMVGVLVLYLGDGFPDHRPTTKDEGSWLGRQVEKVIANPEVGGPITKLLVVLLLEIAWIPLWLR